MTKVQRIRITFAKTRAMQFTGHLDLRRAWTRTFRRANIPLAYSAGFTPRPQFNLAAPLPLGFLSSHELGDFWLAEKSPLPVIKNSLSETIPTGLSIHQLEDIPHIHGEKLPNLVIAAEYLVTMLTPIPELKEKTVRFQNAKEVIRVRRGDRYDLKPLVHSLKILSPNENNQQQIEMELSLLPAATGRPDEVIKELGGKPYEARFTRMMIYLKS